jgi:DAACS family dicarboxylate/amino acid:cation (Na+ or H+) symporter
VSTTAIAASLGLLIVNLLRPGDVVSPTLRRTLLETFASQASQTVEAAGSDVSVTTFIEIIPTNPVTAAAEGNLLAFIFFTIVFAVALTRVPPRIGQPVVQFLEGVAHATMVMIELAMRLAPVGVAGLAFAVTAEFGFDVITPIGLYAGAVLIGLVLYQFGLLGLVVGTLGGVSPAAFFKQARLPMVTAFATASSSATLPTTLRAAEEGLGVPREIAGFVLPLGATLNMNGTAFFEAITVVFLAQAFGVPLGLATQALIVVLTVLTAVSAVGIPSGSIPLIVVMLVTVGVPGEAIALIFGVEPILGMARTSTNVTGDLAASLVVTRAEGLSRGNVTKKRGAGDPAPEHARILISQRAATGTGNGPSTPWAPCRLSDQAW